MTTNDHYPTDFEMLHAMNDDANQFTDMDDMAEFAVENAILLALMSSPPRPEPKDEPVSGNSVCVTAPNAQ